MQLLVGEQLLPVKIPCHAMTGPSRFRQKYIICGKDLRSLPVINHALLEKLAIYGDRGTPKSSNYLFKIFHEINHPTIGGTHIYENPYSSMGFLH